MNCDMVPVDIIASLHRYVHQRCPTGGFLRAVLENNLTEAFCAADENNTAHMREIVAYVYNDIPGICHGSPERVNRWLARKEYDDD